MRFPSKRFVGYLKKVGATENSFEKNGLASLPLERIFLMARNDFLVGELSVDHFSMICDRLWANMIHHGKSKTGTNLDYILIDIADMSHNLRASKEFSWIRDYEPIFGRNKNI